MKRNITFAALITAFSVLLSGCNLENAEYEASARQAASAAAESTAEETQAPEAASSAASSQKQTTTVKELTAVDDIIPAAIQSPRIDGNRLSYSITNVYSGEKYYTVDISGVKLSSTAEVPDIETTYIDGELYGDFRLDLIEQGEIIDTLKINVPRNDRFLIFESVVQDLTYGCEIISNMRQFGDEGYPDIVQLDFHIPDEVEVPQYARYFAVSDGKIQEVIIYEGGAEAAPYGTHLETKALGLMIQQVVAKEYGEYTVKQYEYTFDPEDLTMTRKRVPYTGYD